MSSNQLKTWNGESLFRNTRLYGIKVNFSDHHNTYYSNYKYVTKEDESAQHSETHPDLQNAPKTENAINAKKRKVGVGRSGSKKGQRKRQRERALTVYDVSKIIRNKNITKRVELVCLAVQQKRQGNTALAEFIANKGENAVSDALAIAKEFAEAESKLARSKKTRIDLLKEAKDDGQCCEGLYVLRSPLRCSGERQGEVPKHLYSRAGKLWKDVYIVPP